jgi:hypothetical protein
MKTYNPICGSAEVCLYSGSTPWFSVNNERLTIGRVAELATRWPEATMEFRTIHGLPAIIFTARSSCEDKRVLWMHACIDLPEESVETNANALAKFVDKVLLEWWPDEVEPAEQEEGE